MRSVAGVEVGDLVFNGLRFTKRPARAAGEPNERYHGFYAVRKNGVALYKRDGALEAFLVNNPRQGYFAVTASVANGRARYMFSTCTSTEAWLQIRGMGLQAVQDAIQNMVFGSEGETAAAA